jgi:hypothetical protein
MLPYFRVEALIIRPNHCGIPQRSSKNLRWQQALVKGSLKAFQRPLKGLSETFQRPRKGLHKPLKGF